MTHAFKSHFFHLIWSTKNRTKWIDNEIQSDLYPYMGGIVRNYKGSLIKIGGMPDHVHLLISMKNLEKYSNLIRDVKSHSTLFIRKKHTSLKDFEWQQGFASYALNYSLVDTVENYINNQEKHHQNMTYEEEYLKFLDAQKNPYDPRFVFD